MDKDIFELLKELDIKNVEVAGYKNMHYVRINLNKEDLKKFETQYLHWYINKVEELRKIKLSLEDDVQSLINAIGNLHMALDKACELLEEAICQDYAIFDEVIEGNYMFITEKEEWKEWLMKDEQRNDNM